MSIAFKGDMKSIPRWIKANRVMLSNTGSLVGTTAVTSGLGFVYWWVAARQYAPEAVGLASAIVSTMIMLGNIGMLGLGTLLITELPRQPGREISLVSTSFVVVGGAGAIIGMLFALFAPFASTQFAPLRTSVLNVALFALGVGLTSSTLVLDQAMIGILRGNLQFWRNTLFSLVKLVLLFAAGVYLSQKTGMTIYGAWTAGIALSVVVLFAYTLLKRGWQGKAYLPQWQLLPKLGRSALQHHMLNMILQSPMQLLPLLVTLLLSAKMNAWFYVSWMIANFVFVTAYALTMVLHAMGSAEQTFIRQRARITIGIAFAVCLGTDAVLFFGTKLVLGLFGRLYVEQATWCLRILILAAFPDIIKTHYIAFCRIQDRIAKATSAMLIGGVLELGGAILGAHLDGLLGLCLGWLTAVTVEGLFMLPFVYQMVRPVRSDRKVLSLETYATKIDPIAQEDSPILATIPQSIDLNPTKMHEEGRRE